MNAVNAGMTKLNISFIGAGNVAEALCHGFSMAGQKIVSVCSAGGESARRLAASYNALWMRDYSVPDSCDLVVLAVYDRAVAEVASQLILPDNTILVHTAGSVPLSALGRPERAGVLYPLQTFSRGFTPDIACVPFFIEATDNPTLETLRRLAVLTGAGAWECDSDHRRYLHLAAVFINNFSTFMITAGEEIASRAGFDRSLLLPLLQETTRKIAAAGPAAAQTGPAVRHDTLTMNNHIDLLSFSPQYRDLYRMISDMIMDHNKDRTDDQL